MSIGFSFTTLKRDNIRQTFQACILGGAIGDALGMPLERLSKSVIASMFSLPIRQYYDAIPQSPCYRFGLTKGMYTDDTQSVRATAIAIVRDNVLSAKSIADGLKDWYYNNLLGQSPRYPGVTTNQAMSNYAENMNANDCGVNTNTCGAAIRISPVSLFLSLQAPDKFIPKIHEASRVTHIGEVALDGAMIVASMIKSAVHGETLPIETLLEIASTQRMKTSINMVIHALTKGKQAEYLAEQLGGGTNAAEVVPMSLYLCYKYKCKYHDVIYAGLDTMHEEGLDVDSILSIAGAISGIYCSEEVLSSKHLTGLESCDDLLIEAKMLADCAINLSDYSVT